MEKMIQRVMVPVTVELISDIKTKRILPKSIRWNGRLYPVVKVGLHHSYRAGRVLYHIFSAMSVALCFRLKLDTETLFWQLEEIADGLPD